MQSASSLAPKPALALPHVPVLQWVLSPSIPLRLLLAAQPALTGTGFVQGTRWKNLPGTLLLSESGIGAFVSVKACEALPTAASPHGDSQGTTVCNVWSVIFK